VEGWLINSHGIENERTARVRLERVVRLNVIASRVRRGDIESTDINARNDATRVAFRRVRGVSGARVTPPGSESRCKLSAGACEVKNLVELSDPQVINRRRRSGTSARVKMAPAEKLRESSETRFGCHPVAGDCYRDDGSVCPAWDQLTETFSIGGWTPARSD